ncbi:hypothetical protein HELRODRAFT_170261 [Helobdella robusta]|uniref:Peptidase S1 domain-containing protein n=1 Tax=Helobdella robusta TaxID=6412 RepID=T1F2U6_HELRO|nr:hypothetical protein HELRODRAFT_170261 [Helobdella robusta]ESO07718.1 hypothetical protein HELRODRAFT_170261 [Helobdella robusta]
MALITEQVKSSTATFAIEELTENCCRCFPQGTTISESTHFYQRREIAYLWILCTVSTILLSTFILENTTDYSKYSFKKVFHLDCPEGTAMYCYESKLCLNPNQMCDRFQDCPDDADETNCTCRKNDYQCLRGRCISSMYLCDKHKDCPEGDDESEKSCPACPDGSQYRCSGRSGSCIDVYKRCDLVSDCPETDDEANCGNSSCVVIKKRRSVDKCCWINKNSAIGHILVENNKSLPTVGIKVDPDSDNYTTNAHNSTTECPAYVRLQCENSECGRRWNRVRPKEHVIYGSFVEKGEIPWQAFIKCLDYSCGGVLISQTWVVTAAHCITQQVVNIQASDCVIQFGGVFRHDNWLISRASKLIFHEKYSKPPGVRNDIGLIKLNRPVPLNHLVQPICLPHAPIDSIFAFQSICMSSGFGFTLKNKSMNLLKMRATANRCVTPPAAGFMCISAYEGMGRIGDQNVCDGDSGGPFACRNKNDDRWTLFGVHSHVKQIELIEKLIFFAKASNQKYNKLLKYEVCQNSFVTDIYYHMNWIKDKITDH